MGKTKLSRRTIIVTNARNNKINKVMNGYGSTMHIGSKSGIIARTRLQSLAIGVNMSRTY